MPRVAARWLRPINPIKKRAKPGTFRLRPAERPLSRFSGFAVFYCALIVTVPKFTGVELVEDCAITSRCTWTELPVPLPPEPVVRVVLVLDVLPSQETSPAARTTVSVITRNPRIKAAALNPRCRPAVSIAITIRHSAAKAMLHAIGLPNAGRLCEEGGEVSTPLVGVAPRITVHVVELPWERLSGCGLKLLQESQLGGAPPVSASRQERVTDPEKLLGFTVMVKVAVEFAAERLAELGEIEPGQLLPVPPVSVPLLNKISEFAAPLAWFTQTMSALAFESNPNCTLRLNITPPPLSTQATLRLPFASTAKLGNEEMVVVVLEAVA
jgi:hypothetical protein